MNWSGDWLVKPLGELFEFYGGFFASRAQLSTSGYPYLHYGDIHSSNRTFVDVCADATIPRLAVDLNDISGNALLHNGDVVFVDASEDDEGASKHVVVRNLDNEIFISGLHTIIARAKTDEIHNLYKEFCFQTNEIKTQFKYYAVGTKVTGISKTSIAKILLRFPSDLAEQHTIAEALSDVDTLIENLEKLIAKKEAIKRGAMQELLTGKRRLPGFKGEWGEKNIEEMAEIVSGGTPRTDNVSYWNGGIFWCTPTDITNTNKKYLFITERTITEEGLMNSVTTLLPIGTILLCSRATIGDMCIAARSICTNQGFKNLVCKENVDNEFLYYLLYTKKNEMLELAVGSTFLEISRKALSGIKLKIPTEKIEQTAIATVLSDMDAEIETLTTKLEKTMLIKQGMMQELLTGRKRIWKPEPKIIAFPAPRQKKTTIAPSSHNQQFDDAVMIAGIVDAFYSHKYLLGRKKVQKLLYLLRRYQDESTSAFRKKAAGPYADEVRYKGGEPIAKANHYIETATMKGSGTTFTKGKNIEKALEYLKKWGKKDDIQWLTEKFLYKTVDELELLATVDMAMCDLKEEKIPVSVASIRRLIANNSEWKAKLQRTTFSDDMIAGAIADLEKSL